MYPADSHPDAHPEARLATATSCLGWHLHLLQRRLDLTDAGLVSILGTTPAGLATLRCSLAPTAMPRESMEVYADLTDAHPHALLLAMRSALYSDPLEWPPDYAAYVLAEPIKPLLPMCHTAVRNVNELDPRSMAFYLKRAGKLYGWDRAQFLSFFDTDGEHLDRLWLAWLPPVGEPNPDPLLAHIAACFAVAPEPLVNLWHYLGPTQQGDWPGQSPAERCAALR